MTHPKIVAELSGNHRGELSNALRLIAAAKSAGADAIKLQLYDPERLTLDADGPGFVIDNGPWTGRKLIDLYREAATPRAWFPKLFDHAESMGLECFVSVFDPEGIDYLERQFNCPAYKIASFELADLPLIKAAAATRKPLILSTGMATDAEIADAIDAGHRARSITLLHCVSAYPAKATDANLLRIEDVQDRFGRPVGLSDHTLGFAVPVAAAALDVAMIEKHLTLRRADGGPDAAFSLEPAEFGLMAAAVREACEAMTDSVSPQPYRGLRRSLYAVADIAEGEIFTPANVRSIRPGFGLAPKHLPDLLGKRAAGAITRGSPMTWDLVA